MSEMLRFCLSAGFMLCGIVSILLSILGVFRFRFVMNRMHCAAIIDSVGIFFVILSLVLAAWNLSYIPKLLLILALLWIGSPISSHLVSRMEISTDETAPAHMKIKTGKGADRNGHI